MNNEKFSSGKSSFINIAFFLATILFGLAPILRTALSSVGEYKKVDRVLIALLYNAVIPAIALISFFVVMLISTTARPNPERQMIMKIAMSILLGAMIDLFWLHEFATKLIFLENR